MAKKKNDINQKINKAVDAYFKSNPDTNWFPVKKLMPALLESGAFVKDKKRGLPLRQHLRELLAKGKLEAVPRAYGEKIGSDRYWYFVREGAEFISNHVTEAPNAKQRKAIEQSNSDEVYLMDMIDGLLKETGSRKHTFDYLLGDLHQNGKTRTELALDLYYPKLNLVIEFIKHPGKKESADRSKEEKETVSGITRAEQRLKYFNRKRKVMTEKEKNFIAVPFEKFDVDETSNLVRVKKNDEKVLLEMLALFTK